jgi:hypothetical protein
MNVPQSQTWAEGARRQFNLESPFPTQEGLPLTTNFLWLFSANRWLSFVGLL